MKGLKVAIVCDWLVSHGGAERVVYELHRMFPGAPIYTSQADPSALPWIDKADVRTGWLQRLPKALRKFLPVLRAIYFSRLDLSEYDVVISSSGAEAKFIRSRLGTTHICYCHAPTHYYWLRYEQYLTHPGFGKLDFLARLGLRILVGPMRLWDKAAAQRPNWLIANSTFTAGQIQKYYGREAHVVHPPVDTERFESKTSNFEPRYGFVVAGRQTPYKRIDLAVKACGKLGLPLTVIGDGPEHYKLVGMAGPSVSFLTNVSDAQMPAYFAGARALIFPTDQEDFGVTAVEALAAGTPVIAYHGGGPLDYIQDGENGLFFDKLTVSSLVETLQRFEEITFNNAKVAKSAESFSRANFRKNFETFISGHPGLG